jgi:hypothetical protein
MCFSATASFTTAAVTGSAGWACLSRADHWRQVPFAAIPLLFAAQQASEGFIWLSLDHNAAAPVQVFVSIFLGIALVVWPVWVPAAIGLLEAPSRNRWMILSLSIPGIVCAFYSLLSIRQHPYSASLGASGICYGNNLVFPEPILLLYLISACLPGLLSSDRAVRMFGLAVSAGMVISLALYQNSFISVWCFFAALASTAIFVFFHHRHVQIPVLLIRTWRD